ncbi:uncharacterized protein ATNIH1004_004882 [Aspergillus tanneri]|nr:uncharacterized protein ATNIH1004_004882 [Aspergillus tanneri]KAA8648992.1 hypothetical protein ATNIH1004_004882 [Aspergillus tanneri]
MSPPLRTSSYHQDPLIYIDRQAKHLQRNLQVLIDAQGEGLLAGLRDQSEDSSLSSGGYTPNSDLSNVRGPSTLPVRQPVPKKIGLRAAREGIFSSVYNLLKLREKEREVLASRFDERQDALMEIDGFGTKREGLEDALSTIHNNRESQRSKELRDESRQLESDIHEMETRLSQVKARHRQVTQELSQMENTVESKLSSYKASLSLLESDIWNFLQNPPVSPHLINTNHQTFYTLNPKRRTLDMAQEQWKNEQMRLKKRQQEVDTEIEALEEGGGMWKLVVGEVSGFEKRLEMAMRRSIQRQSQLLSPDGPSGSKSDEEQARSILADLDNTTGRVEHHLEIAEEKGWKLLVCCIGSELEALREARKKLLGVFNVSEEDIWPSPHREGPSRSRVHDDNDSEADPLGVDNPEPPPDLLKDAEEHSHDVISKSGDEDEDPDPAWLLPES